MKAEGIEYEQRMEELEKLEYPKPNRDFIYSTFNAFADAHPWVGQENIRPKSIAREMFEHYRSFADYIKEYELQRAEGLLLRHLSGVHKVLTQTVPDAAKNEAVREMELYLGTMLRQVDSSLLDEWERMRDPNYLAHPRCRGSAPARRRGSRARHHARREGLHRGDPQSDLHLPARAGESGVRSGAGSDRPREPVADETPVDSRSTPHCRRGVSGRTRPHPPRSTGAESAAHLRAS